MSQVWVVAAHEFRTAVLRWGYVFVAVILPIFMAGAMVVSTKLLGGAMEKQEQELYDKVAVIDLAGVLRGDPPPKLVRAADEAETQEAIRARAIKMYVLIPADYLDHGRVTVKVAQRPTLFGAGEMANPPAELRTWIQDSLLTEARVEHGERVKEPFAGVVRAFLDPATGEPSKEDFKARATRVGIAVGFFFVMFMAMVTSGGYLLQGLADEKENRVMEMVLYAVSAERLLAGKLLGLGAAGFLQLVIWAGLGVAGLLYAQLTLLMDPSFAALGLVFFLLGYVLYGALLLGTGCIGTNLREVSQWSAIWTFPQVLPMIFWNFVILEPNSTLARVLSYFPLTTAVTAVLRISSGMVPAWEIALMMLVLAVSAAGVLWAAARIYRVGLLLYGQRPTPRNLWRWLRA